MPDKGDACKCEICRNVVEVSGSMGGRDTVCRSEDMELLDGEAPRLVHGIASAKRG